MQITQIEQTGKKCRIYLNDEPAFLLYPSEVRTYKLAEGEELSEETRERIFQEVLIKRARLRCMHILKSTDKTEYQLRLKLQQEEYPEEIADDALEYVKSYHYVDDERYAENYIRSKASSRSRMQLKTDLLSKGIRPDAADKALEALTQEDEQEQILAWLRKKRFDPGTASEEEKNALIRSLMRRGFSYGMIKNALTDNF